MPDPDLDVIDDVETIIERGDDPREAAIWLSTWERASHHSLAVHTQEYWSAAQRAQSAAEEATSKINAIKWADIASSSALRRIESEAINVGKQAYCVALDMLAALAAPAQPGGATTSPHRDSSVDVGRAVKTFSSLVRQTPAIDDVVWRFSGKSLQIWTVLNDYDRSTEDTVYGAEEVTLDMFPALRMDFQILYRHGRSLSAIRPPGTKRA